MKKYVIIVAGGIGKRMKSDIPKQFLCLRGIPILMRCIDAFKNYDKNINVILVLLPDQKNNWLELCKKHNFKESFLVVSGGNTRFQSVKNGLALIKDDNCLISVHDGVRPLVSKDTIARTFDFAEKNGNAIPCININDSLRIIDKDSSLPLDRSKVVIIQTPQCFKSDLLKKAYEQDYNKKFTDDATVVENIGGKIFLTEGNIENIKITTQKDLLIAEVLLKK